MNEKKIRGSKPPCHGNDIELYENIFNKLYDFY